MVGGKAYWRCEERNEAAVYEGRKKQEMKMLTRYMRDELDAKIISGMRESVYKVGSRDISYVLYNMLQGRKNVTGG